MFARTQGVYTYRTFDGKSRMAYNLARAIWWSKAEPFDMEWNRIARQLAMAIIAGNY